MTQKARNQLTLAEQESRARILNQFQLLQGRMKIRLSSLLEEIKILKDDDQPVPVTFLFERQRLATLLVDLNAEIESIQTELLGAVTDQQKKAVNIANDDFNDLIQTASNSGQIVRFNPAATASLIQNTVTGAPLEKLLSGLAPDVALKVKNALIDGVAAGLSAREIASGFNTALGSGAARALTIARTESNNAYRQANIMNYQDNAHIVDGYVWISALDLRTCVICWSRHGKIYPLQKKPLSHVNCRCTMTVYMPAVTSTGVETGVDKFKRLTNAQKIAIIGKKRFELYQSGLELDDFVSEQQTEFGKVPFIVPIDQLPDPKTKKQTALPVKKTKKTPDPKPIIKTQPKTAAEAARSLKALGKQYDKQIKAAKDAEASVMIKYRQAWSNFSGTTSEYRQQISKELDQAREKVSALETDQRSKALELIKVGNPTNVKAKFASKTMAADERARINKVLAEFNSLVSGQYLKDETFSYHLIRGRRAYYGLKKDVHISRNESETTIMHETAHGLEHINQTVLDSAVDFWNHRTKGEKLETLKKLTGLNYRSNEKAKKDKFFNVYDGKEPYRANNKIYATEIISRGIEYYWSDPVKMAVEQPEYFDFMYRVLRGEKWQPKSK